ncbi:MAG: hypothetical protein K2X81_06730 [Candidatus Obscuribacterales bacterium]|nr:hypothetical protein [Candidatus Obscuribacterales bacterium]
MTHTVAPALSALLERFIDYAGLFPPAQLPLDEALLNYKNYRNGEYAWMLRCFVVSAAQLKYVPERYDTYLSVLSEADEVRAAVIESNSIVAAQKPVYCEVSLANLDKLNAVKNSPCFAKIRTGGLKPEAIPSPAEVATFILKCAELRLPFKATAGLHHPIRASYPLCYEPDALHSVMHGFLNVLMASAFAWHGYKKIEPILAETDPRAFVFNERAHWRNESLSAEEILDARSEFIHSVGSCSFDEPVQELKALHLL